MQTMPLITGVDHDQRTVGVVAVGTVTASDVRDHWLHRRREQSLRYPELADARGAALASTTDDIQQIAELLNELNREGPLGSIAIIVSSDANLDLMRGLEALVEGVCELKTFRDEESARAWLAAASAEPSSK
jgi:hypothetical protein